MGAKPDITTIEIEEFFKEYYTLLCLVAYSIVKDREVAKDVVQDFFISYWQKRGTISISISFKAYAVKAVKNLSFRVVEKAKKKGTLPLILKDQDYPMWNPMDRSQKYEKILELLNQLPSSRKEIFISFVVYGQSYAQIAESNGISVNTVKTQMKRSYAFLRSKAKESGLTYLFLATLLKLF